MEYEYIDLAVEYNDINLAVEYEYIDLAVDIPPPLRTMRVSMAGTGQGSIQHMGILEAVHLPSRITR